MMNATKSAWVQWGVTVVITAIGAYVSMSVAVARIEGKIEALKESVDARLSGIDRRLTLAEQDLRTAGRP